MSMDDGQCVKEKSSYERHNSYHRVHTLYIDDKWLLLKGIAIIVGEIAIIVREMTIIVGEMTLFMRVIIALVPWLVPQVV